MKQLLMLVLIVPTLLLGCEAELDGKPSPGKAPTLYGPFAATLEHDSHKFIVFYKAASGSANGGMSAMHHPDCGCLKAPASK